MMNDEVLMYILVQIVSAANYLETQVDLEVGSKSKLKHHRINLAENGKRPMLKHLFEFTKSLDGHQQGHSVKQEKWCHHSGVFKCYYAPPSVHFQQCEVCHGGGGGKYKDLHSW